MTAIGHVVTTAIADQVAKITLNLMFDPYLASSMDEVLSFESHVVTEPVTVAIKEKVVVVIIDH